MYIIYYYLIYSSSRINLLKCRVNKSYIEIGIKSKKKKKETKSRFETRILLKNYWLFSDGGDRVVIRSCAIPNHDETDITDGPCSPLMTNGRDMVESCHICSTDLCNSASSLSTTQSLYIVGFILIGYRFFKSNYNRVI